MRGKELTEQMKDDIKRCTKEEDVSYLLQKTDLVSYEDADGNTVAHIAAIFGKSSFLRLLGGRLPKFVNLKNKMGRTPLHLTARHNSDRNDVELIIKNGGDMNQKEACSGNTALHIALDRFHIALTETLLEMGANPNIQNKEGDTCLHFAVRTDTLDIVKRVYESGANLKIRNKKKATALSGKIRHNILVYLREKKKDLASKKKKSEDASILVSKKRPHEENAPSVACNIAKRKQFMEEPSHSKILKTCRDFDGEVNVLAEASLVQEQPILTSSFNLGDEMGELPLRLDLSLPTSESQPVQHEKEDILPHSDLLKTTPNTDGFCHHRAKARSSSDSLTTSHLNVQHEMGEALLFSEPTLNSDVRQFQKVEGSPCAQIPQTTSDFDDLQSQWAEAPFFSQTPQETTDNDPSYQISDARGTLAQYSVNSTHNNLQHQNTATKSLQDLLTLQQLKILLNHYNSSQSILDHEAQVMQSLATIIKLNPGTILGIQQLLKTLQELQNSLGTKSSCSPPSLS